VGGVATTTVVAGAILAGVLVGAAAGSGGTTGTTGTTGTR